MLCFCRIRRPPRSTRACTLCPSTTFCRASGPVVLSAALAPFAPLPFVTKDASGFRLIEEENAGEDHPQTFGRMTAFHGQMGMRSDEHTYETPVTNAHLVCRLLLNTNTYINHITLEILYP